MLGSGFRRGGYGGRPLLSKSITSPTAQGTKAMSSSVSGPDSLMGPSDVKSPSSVSSQSNNAMAIPKAEVKRPISGSPLKPGLSKPSTEQPQSGVLRKPVVAAPDETTIAVTDSLQTPLLTAHVGPFKGQGALAPALLIPVRKNRPSINCMEPELQPRKPRNDLWRQSLKRNLSTIVEIPIRTASFSSGVLNLLPLITGNPSAVGLAIALTFCGLWTGLFIMVGLSILGAFSACLAVEIGQLRKVDTYPELAYDLFGRCGYTIVLCIALIIDFGSVLAQLIFIGDNLSACSPHLPQAFAWLGNRSAALFVGCLIVVPLCFLRDLSILSRATGASILLAMAVMISIAVTGYVTTEFVPPPQEVEPYAIIKYDTLMKGATIIAFCVVINDGVFPVHNSLATSSVSHWRKVVTAAFFIATIVNMSFAAASYLSFYSETTSDVLTNFVFLSDSYLNQLVGWLRFAFALSLCFSTPLMYFVTRTYLLLLMKASRKGGPTVWQPTTLDFYSITIFSLGCAVMIAFLVSDLGTVLQLAGSFGSSTLFFLPSLFWYKARKMGYLENHPDNRWPRNLMCVIIFGVGMFLLVGGCVQFIVDVTSCGFC